MYNNKKSKMSIEFDMERLSCGSDIGSPVCPNAPVVKPLSYHTEL